MSIDWRFYNEQRQKRGLQALDEATARVLEDFAADNLQLGRDARASEWGRAEGYGLYSAAVIRTNLGIQHPFRDVCESVAIKIFHSAADKVIQFQREVFPRIWQLPLQKTLHGGIATNQTGKRRGYLVLEFVEGMPLDQLVAGPTLPAQVLENLLREFLQGCLIPLWASSYRFWDFRPANLVVKTPGTQMVMIDTDTLAAAAEEILNRGDDWTQRNQWERLAFQRLPGQIAAILRGANTQPAAALRRASKQALKQSGLLDALHLLGRAGPEAYLRARETSERLIQELLGAPEVEH
jgi:hypothetical protein